MNLSQQKRQRMLEFLSRIREEHKDDDATLIALNEIESELNSKKYGLVWEEHEEAVDVQMRTHIPVFTEDTSREIAALPDGDYNFLLEGDNLHSLYLLEKTHKGRIDVIYIDPPYNTGNKDFKYNDAFVDTQDGFRHSKWLSFMSKRLSAARNLLSDKGVIFISVDDNEQSQLKMLCDEIFGIDCIVANISWQWTYSIRNDSKGIPLEVEHILVYSKFQNWQPNKLPRTEKMDASYKNPDGDRCSWMSGSPIASDAKTHQGMVYAIQHPFTGKMLYPNVTAHWRYSQEQMLEYMNGWCPYELKDLNDAEKRAEICGVSKDEVRADVKAIVLSKPYEESKKIAQKVYDIGPWPRFYFTSGGKGGIRRKVYADSVDGRISTNYWMYDEVGHTDEAKKELKTIFNGAIPFDTPKPVRLIERILQIASNKNSVVLDFFAGSGTTAQAVLELNKQDGGSRRFILCTNNENNICEEVTYQRIKTVITGKRKDGSVYSEGIPANLKYYRTDFVERDEEYLSEALLEHIAEMIQLENGVKIDGSKYIMVLDEEEADELAKNWASYPDVKAIYAANDILFTTEQAELFAGTEINIIPDYYFEFELREEGETW